MAQERGAAQLSGDEIVALARKHTLFELREAFAIVDRGLELTDRAVKG